MGRAVKNSDIDRDDIWITSKLWPSDYGEKETPKAIDKMLDRLQTDHIDLLLLHQQFGDYLGAWKAMEKALDEGKLRSIGISNFDGERLDNLLNHANVKPQVMQVELHPYYQQNDLKAKMAQYGTQFESWYPLGHGDATLINEPIFTKLAQKYGKTNVQVILRWHIQKGNIVFPKTTNPQHMKDNIDIFDFELTDDEMKQIDTLDKGQRYFNMPLSQQEAMFKSFKPAD